MNLYNIFMAPLEKSQLHSIRKKLIPKAYGDVLEIGAGTGVNCQYYDMDNIKSYTLMDKNIQEIAKETCPKGTILTEGDAMQMPFPDYSFDTVVETLVLCSIEDEAKAIKEIARILKPQGIFLHLDHGLPAGSASKRLFNFIAPLWHAITRSCRINKNFKHILKNSELSNIEEHSPGSGVFYWGVSKKSGIRS